MPGSLHPWQIAAEPMLEPEYLTDVLRAASDIALVVSDDGNVMAALANDLTAPLLSFDEWIGRPLKDFLTDDSISKFDSVMQVANSGAEMPRMLELNHKNTPALIYPVRYSTHRVGREGAILMLGRDLQQVAETQQQLVQAQVALERGYAERREYDARYRMLLSATREAFVVISIVDGRILDLNASAATLLGASRDELQGAILAKQFKSPRPEEFGQNLVSLSQSENDNAIAMQSKRTHRSLSLTPSAFRVAGEQMVICRLDLEAPSNHQGDRLSAHLKALFRNGIDGVVITDAKGVIENANQAFVEMVDYVHHADVKGNSLAEYLSRGQIDLTAVLDTALQAGHMPFHATKLKNALGGSTPVEIAATYLPNSAQPVVGFTLRDMTRAEALRVPKDGRGNTEQRASAVDLVGQASLRDIVTATSDVVEKMCIEAALEMTKNNRVAAAEILGLSRQSLYVKLRKLGLVDARAES